MTAADYQLLTGKKAAKKPATNKVQSPLAGGNRGYQEAGSLLNAIWMKSEAFIQVADCGTHLEAQSVDGQWYRLDLTKIDKPSKSQ